MICPACGNSLSNIVVEGIAVDICSDGCGGIWFDNFELEKMDEKHESAGEKLLGVPIKKGVTVDLEEKRDCPCCDDVKMMKHFFSVQQKVEVDECAGCGGIWLDAGELREIRDLYATEEERKAAAEKYFSGVFDAATSGMREKDQEALAKAKKFAKAFRFLCPSYYIPGDQPWGAF